MIEQKVAKVAKERIEMKGILLRCSVFVCLVCFVVVSLSHAQSVPPYVSYQGRVNDQIGEPVAGIRSMAVSIYTNETTGAAVWGPQIFPEVHCVGGFFNVILGPADIDSNSIAVAASFGDTWVEVVCESVTNDRQRILSVPFALGAHNGVPVGTILPWHKNVVAPPLPVPTGWVECSGGTVDDPYSPIQGASIPNLNDTSLAASPIEGYGGGGFLRGSTTSGVFQAATQHNFITGHEGASTPNIYAGKTGTGWTVPDADKALRTDYGVNNVAGAGNIYPVSKGVPAKFASRPVNMSVVWIMKVR